MKYIITFFIIVFSFCIFGCGVQDKINIENKLENNKKDFIYWDGVDEKNSDIKFSFAMEKKCCETSV